MCGFIASSLSNDELEVELRTAEWQRDVARGSGDDDLVHYWEDRITKIEKEAAERGYQLRSERV